MKSENGFSDGRDRLSREADRERVCFVESGMCDSFTRQQKS
jgi:hypothetical protein